MEKKKLLIVICLLLIVGINFYLYSAEFKVLVDPNDNIFQYALIDEAKDIWKQIFAGKLSPIYLLDSWNERWAEGFALSSYYAHLPQAVMALFGGFKLFVVVRTVMLILMPLMFFFGARILGVSWLPSLLVSLFSQTIFTDGLYGIDVSSFIWRGWGLSAQLMAVFFLPVAFAYAVDYFETKRNLGKAIFFNFLVASCHFGIFSLALLGYPVYWVVSVMPNIFRNLDSGQARMTNQILKLVQDDNSKKIFVRLAKFLSLTLFSLSYFIIPFFTQGQYRTFSVWDPIWKFDSWGIRQIIIWFLNGDMFDFGRLPFITLSVIFGAFLGFAGKNKLFRFLSLLFVLYFVLFLGRATLGGLIDLIPGFSEFHQHRIIVLVQFTGIFLGAWLLYRLLLKINSLITKYELGNANYIYIGVIILFIPLFIFLEKPLINYAKDNSVWIDRSNKAFIQDKPNYEKIKAKLTSLPRARVYVGRPGNWGRQFTVGETPLYMVLSQDGFPTIGFLPESWSPNSDPEQFFNENDINFYNLYNVGYSILPQDIKPPVFTKLITKEGKYSLYEINTTGWFAAGISNIAVKSKKTELLNPTRLWFETDLFKNGDYPMIDLSKKQPDGKRWYIQMTDKNNWINLNDGKERNLWQANPFGTSLQRPLQKHTISTSQQQKLINGYKTMVDVSEDCPNCILVLKQSFHPNWQVRVNGEKVNTFPVFPFYIGIPVEKVGSYEVLSEYKPGVLKGIFVWLEILVFGYIFVVFLSKRAKVKKIER